MKKSITYKDGQRLNNVIFNYFITKGYFIAGIPATADSPAKPGRWSDLKPTKLVANMKNIDKQWAKIFEEYTSLRDDLQLDHCATDEKTKVILMNENGSRKFTVEGEKALKKAIKELDEKEVELHVRITTEGIDDLSDAEKEVFNGILIPAFEVATEEE